MAATQQPCSLPLSSRFNTDGVQRTSQPELFIRPPDFPRRSFMSLNITDHLPLSTKQDRVRMQGHPDKHDHSATRRTKMVRLTVNVPADLADRMRDAMYWTPGLTLAWFIASSVRMSLAELESTNRAPFPKRARQLRAGRPRLMGQSLKLRPSLTRNGTFQLAESSSPITAVSRSNHD